jgi:hypothetical protein
VLRVPFADRSSCACPQFGYGFPAWRGGVLKWAKEVGLRHVRDRLKYYSETMGSDNPTIRAFFAPSTRLEREANMS